MAISAWPFLIAPTQSAPPRLVVAPDWVLADQRLVAGLRQSPIQVAASDLGTPGAATTLTPVSTDAGDFCLVYRVLKVRLRDYGLGGDEPARDHVRRPIEAIEGLVLRCSEGEAEQLRIGPADLDKVHAAVTRPYQSYWHHPESFRLQGTSAFPLSGPHDPVPGSPVDPQAASGAWRLVHEPGCPATVDVDNSSDEPTGTDSGTEREAAPGPDPDRPRGRILVLCVAAAVIGAGIAIAIARPWSRPSVQPPQNLRGQATSATAITVAWSPPASGTPDHYELFLGGTAIRVPGTVTSYPVTRLTPVTRYRVQLQAFANGMPSRRSGVITITTPAPPEPPLALTLLRGKRQTMFTPTSFDGTYRAGNQWSSWWTVTPACSASSCPVAVSGTIDGARGRAVGFSVALPLDGTGTAHAGDIKRELEKCGTAWVPATVTIEIRPAYAAVYDDGTWIALGWQGTLTIRNSPVPGSLTHEACPASVIRVDFSS